MRVSLLLDVLLYSRKPRTTGNHSVELINDLIVRKLRSKLRIANAIAPTFSQGLIPRLRIMGNAFQQKAKVIHVTGDINFAVLLLRNSKIVCTILDCGFLNITAGLKRSVLKWIWLTLPVKRSNLVIAISEAAKSDIIEKLGFTPGKIRVIHCPLPEDCRPSPKTFNVDCPQILQIGTAPNKNVHRLIKALSGLKCRLIVIGKMDESLRSLARDHQIDLLQHDVLSRADLIRAYEESDILSFCSLIEGFGMPIVEANAIGRVVVTSNVSSMPEVAGDSAVLVDPNSIESIRSGILTVINEPEIRDQLISTGLANAERFRSTKIAEKYFDVYKELLNRT